MPNKSNSSQAKPILSTPIQANQVNPILPNRIYSYRNTPNSTQYDPQYNNTTFIHKVWVSVCKFRQCINNAPSAARHYDSPVKPGGALVFWNALFVSDEPKSAQNRILGSQFNHRACIAAKQ